MNRVILGIDPGLNRTGYAIVECIEKRPIIREAGVLTTCETDALEVRLKNIYDSVEDVVSEFHPDVVVVEQLYSHYEHPQTSVIMGHARGIVLLCAAKHNIPVVSYASTRIKKSLTGNGRATKMQIQRTVKDLMKLESLPEPPDVADAIAAALCHIESLR